MSGQYQYEQYQYEQYRPAPYQAPSGSLALPVPYPLTDQRPVSVPVVVIAWVVTALTSLYMLPWAIAASRGKANQWSIFAVDLLLGWTGIGWIVALVMACTSHRPLAAAVPLMGYAAVPTPAVASPAGWYPNPTGPGRRYWDGFGWTGHIA